MINAARRDYWYGLPFEDVQKRLRSHGPVERQATLRDLVRTDARRPATKANVDLIRRVMYKRIVGAQTLVKVAELVLKSPAARAYSSTGQHDSARLIWEYLRPLIAPTKNDLAHGLAAIIPGIAQQPLALLICAELAHGGYLKGSRKGAVEAIERMLEREAPRMADLGALVAWPKSEGALLGVAGLGDLQHEVSAVVAPHKGRRAKPHGLAIVRQIRAVSGTTKRRNLG
jgi:hypothetical protein